MILKKVKLENFISHEDSELDLDYGINVITGPNGAGKTSILDAISFGLFNIHSRGKKKYLINSRANKSKTNVEFSEGGITYYVEWSIERNKAAHGALFKIQNDTKTLLARGGERVIVSEVENILELDKDLFLQSVYIRQGEIEDLVTATPAKRKELISKLLGQDYLETAWRNIKEVITEYSLDIAKLQGELNKVSEIKDEILQNETKMKNLGKSFGLKKIELTEIEARIDALQKELDQLDQDKDRFDKLESERKILEREIENTESRLQDKETQLKRALQAHENVEKLRDKIKKLSFLENYVQALTEKETNELRKNNLQTQLDTMEKLNRILQDNKEQSDSYAEKTNLVEKKREDRKSFEGAEEGLRRVRRELAKNKKEIAKKSKNLTIKLDDFSKTLEEQVNVENLESVLLIKRSEFQKIKLESESKADDSNQKIGALKEKIDDLKLKLSQISEAEVCPICKTKLTPNHIQQLQSEFTVEKKKADDHIVALKHERKKANQEKKEAEAKLESTATIDPLEIKTLVQQIEETRVEIAQQKSETKELEVQVGKLKKLNKEIETLVRETRNLEESYQNYESAKREIARLPSKEKIESELKPIMAKLDEISLKLQESEKNLAYKPINPAEELQTLRKDKEEYDRNEPIAKTKTELEQSTAKLSQKLLDKQSELDNITKKIEKLAYNERIHKERKEQLKTEDKRKSEVGKEVVEVETTIRSLNEETAKRRNQLNQLSKKEQEKKRTEGFVEILNRIRNAFGKDGIQKLIRARARPMLEKITRDYFEKFNLEYSDIKIDDDYNIVVIGPTGLQTLDQISGGERVALAIALRLAIARVLSEKVETIIMDEPTTHLDEERRKELVNILNSFFREGGRIIPQMLIITHHHEIEDVADVIYNVNKKEGYSVVEAGVTIS